MDCEIPDSGDQIVLGIKAPDERGVEEGNVRNSLSKLQKKREHFQDFRPQINPSADFGRKRRQSGQDQKNLSR